ncbi:MAG: winged helix-turn-helix transcriptional regulator [Bacteroidetes bacterium]|nr:winged helix-turn-helix transcriptional regulator [Bacteroidota bacterium]
MNALFKALDDPTRREIIELLRHRDMTAGEIAERFDISKPSISYHLQLLQQADLVVAVRKGQFIQYSLNTTVVQEAIAWLIRLTKQGNKK